MRRLNPRRWLQVASPLLALALSVVLSSCVSTTPQLVERPRLLALPPPAECTRVAIEAFAPQLSGLPAGYAVMSDADQARTLLSLKASDTTQYQLLRAQALRCAR